MCQLQASVPIVFSAVVFTLCCFEYIISTCCSKPIPATYFIHVQALGAMCVCITSWQLESISLPLSSSYYTTNCGVTSLSFSKTLPSIPRSHSYSYPQQLKSFILKSLFKLLSCWCHLSMAQLAVVTGISVSHREITQKVSLVIWKWVWLKYKNFASPGLLHSKGTERERFKKKRKCQISKTIPLSMCSLLLVSRTC